MVVHGDTHRLLRLILTDHVVAEEFVDLFGLGQFVELQVTCLVELFLDDLVTEVDAFVADVDAGSCDELLDLLLTLSAERALQQIPAVADACHCLDPLCCCLVRRYLRNSKSACYKARHVDSFG